MRGFILRLVAIVVSFLLLLGSPAIAALSNFDPTVEKSAVCEQLSYSKIDLFDLRFSLPAPYSEVLSPGANSSEIHFLTSEDEGGNYAVVGIAAPGADALGITDKNPEVVLERIAIAFASQNIDQPEKARAEFEVPAFHPETGLYSARLVVDTAYGVEMTMYIVLNEDSGTVGLFALYTRIHPTPCILQQLDDISIQRLF